MEIIAMDAHKHYSQVCVQKQNGEMLCEEKIFIVKRPWQDNVTLAHEIGHKVGLHHPSGGDVTLRIMNAHANGSGTEDRIIPSEKTKYATL